MSRGSIRNTMDCYDFSQQVDTFIDGELDFAEHEAMEEHSRRCLDCNEKEARRRDTRQRLRNSAAGFKPSNDFMQRLNASLAAQSIGSQEASCPNIILHEHEQVLATDEQTVSVGNDGLVSSAIPLFSKSLRRSAWIGLAAAALLALSIGFSLGSKSGDAVDASAAVAGVSSMASPVVGESVAWHRRNVPVEVVGPDPAAVREWFSDKVSFAVSVPDFGRSARLLGGRLGHVRQYEAAYLLYEASGGKLSVMLFDAGDMGVGMDFNEKTFVDNSNGYNVAIRERAGVTYTFTSDMEADELAAMVDQVMAR